MALRERLLDVGDIAIPRNRLRARRPDLVVELARSIETEGLIHPILVREGDGGLLLLVAGRHRLEAAKSLGMGKIRAEIVDHLSADEARISEIDENLMRGELTAAERAKHVAARKVIYERLHPETKAGGDRRSSNRPKGEVKRFTKATATLTKKSERSVQRDAERGVKVKVLDEVVGTSLDKPEELDALAKLSPEEQRKLAQRASDGEKVSAKTRVKQVARSAKEKALGDKQRSLPDKRYGAILADPEWKFETWSEEGMDRAAENHYPTSLLERIQARDVASISADDCALFLYVPGPLIEQGLQVLNAWGFTYRTQWVIVKDRFITGYWNRGQHEVLLLGVRGKPPAPAQGTQWSSVINYRVTQHSAKPEAVLEMIEGYFPTLPKIELNRRGAPRPGWDAWGNEAFEAAG